jgi:flagellar hook-basal body complex protein FliE
MRIDSVSNPGLLSLPAVPAEHRPSSSFFDLLGASIRQTNQLQLHAEELIAALASGQAIEPEVIAIAVNKADLAFRTLLQIRNKLVDAFTELRQMQV